ncbi:MAG: ROK family protein [Lachnospiraceae bacterium]|nr:ROK family protein [Lachnospiraceae bacterium]
MTQMINTTAQVKENNKKLILETLLALKQATKNTVAKETGLSVATCNTLLNELARANEIVVVPQEKKPSGAGRPSKTYCVNHNSYTVCCISLFRDQGVNTMGCRIYNSMNYLVAEKEDVKAPVTYDSIHHMLESLTGEYDNIKIISIGIHGTIDVEGRVQNSCFSSLNGINLIQNIDRDFALPVIIDNQINLITYGFYKQLEDSTIKNVITLSFDNMKCTAAGFILNGQLLHGKDNAAGDVSLLSLPPESSTRGIFRTSTKASAEDVMAKTISTFIQLLNPDIILLTGSGISISLMGILTNACSRYIPEEHMPEFSYTKDSSTHYQTGLLEMASLYEP